MTSLFIFIGPSIYIMWKKRLRKDHFWRHQVSAVQVEIMVGSDQIIIDEVELGVHLIRNKIGEIFQDVFVREVNHLIYVAVNEHCDGCKMDDLSQLHHTCLTMDAQ